MARSDSVAVMGSQDDFAQAVEIVPGLSFVWVRRPDAARTSHIAAAGIAYTIDAELLYEPFFADFGPLNLGRTFRFCKKTQELLQEAGRQRKRLFLYAGPHVHQKANAAVLLGIYQVMFLGKSAEEAYRPLANLKPFAPFRDASCGVSTFHLTVFDCIKGLQKARDVGFIDWMGGTKGCWNLEEYEHYEQVEAGDLNWIVPGKFVAFSGPAARGNEIPGYRLLTPEDYWDYFKRKGVTSIVRLNKKVYDRKRFTDGGFRHYDLYFPDGSCPSDPLLFKFLEMMESEPGSTAIHCKAGLGRTGVLICCFLMKHFRFTAEEVIGYIRVCRPGSVIGPQQNYICAMQARMWAEGDLYRQKHGPYRVGVTNALGNDNGMDLAISGRAAADAEAAGGGRPGIALGRRSDSATSITGADMSLLQYSKMQYGGTNAVQSYNHGGNGTPTSSSSNAGSSSFSNSSGSSNGSSGGRVSASGQRYIGRSVTPLRYGTAGLSGGGSTFGSLLGAGYTNVSASAPAPSSHAHVQGPLLSRMPSSPSSVARSMPHMAGAQLGPGGRAPSADSRSAAGGMRASASMQADALALAERPRARLPERNALSAVDVASSWRTGGSVGGSSSGPNSPSAASTGTSPFGNGGSGGLAAASSMYAKAVGPRGSSASATAAAAATSAGLRSLNQAVATGGNVSVTAGNISLVPSSVGHSHHGVARILAPNGQPRKVPMSMLSSYQAARVEAAAAATAAAASESLLGGGGGSRYASVGGGGGGAGGPGGVMAHLDAARTRSVTALRYGLSSK